MTGEEIGNSKTSTHVKDFWNSQPPSINLKINCKSGKAPKLNDKEPLYFMKSVTFEETKSNLVLEVLPQLSKQINNCLD
jgi:hypothetical protein